MNMAVYLLHFADPVHHARHYLGYASNIVARIRQHRNGGGARLLQVLVERGVGFGVARVWLDGDRADERRLKRCKNGPRLYPICAGRTAVTDDYFRKGAPPCPT